MANLFLFGFLLFSMTTFLQLGVIFTKIYVTRLANYGHARATDKSERVCDASIIFRAKTSNSGR